MIELRLEAFVCTQSKEGISIKAQIVRPKDQTVAGCWLLLSLMNDLLTRH